MRWEEKEMEDLGRPGEGGNLGQICNGARGLLGYGLAYPIGLACCFQGPNHG